MKKPYKVISLLFAALLIIIESCEKEETVTTEKQDVISAEELEKIIAELNEINPDDLEQYDLAGFKSSSTFSTHVYNEWCGGYNTLGTYVEFDADINAPGGYAFFFSFKVYSEVQNKYLTEYNRTTYGTHFDEGTRVQMIWPLFSWYAEDKEDIHVVVFVYLHPLSGGSLLYGGSHTTNSANTNVRGNCICCVP